MDSVLYSWLAAAAVAPFVVILSCWTLAVFRSYRPDWRLLDIFLYGLTCLEVASALFSFGYAILGAIRPDLEAPCLFLVWGLTATRVFHLSTVTSLLLDRALASKWSGKYRSSVRHSQVRYHIIVLGIISVFVGVTSVFARLPNPANTCSLHPLDWDIKFSAFLACVYGMLLLTGFGCCLVVQAGRFRSRGSYRTTSCSRDSATSHSSASCEETRDLEWAVVASICWLSYMVNHGPYLSTMGTPLEDLSIENHSKSRHVCTICDKSFRQKFTLTRHLKIHNEKKDFVCHICEKGFTRKSHLKGHMNIHKMKDLKSDYVLSTLGMAVPTFWSPWMDNSVVWLRLVQGLLVPCVLLLADMPHRSALRTMLRQSGRVYRHLSDHGGFRMQIGETTKPSYPLYPPFHVAPFPQRLRWSPTNLPSLQSLQHLDADTLRKGYGSAGYTTLLSMPSSTTTSFSSPYSSCSSMGQSMNSVTTNAVNDFVFRRPSVLALFEPSPRGQPDARIQRCDTPTPFSEDHADYESICNCDVAMDHPREGICNCNTLKQPTLGDNICNCNNLGDKNPLSKDGICNCNHLVDKKIPLKDKICNCTALVNKKPSSRQATCNCNLSKTGSSTTNIGNAADKKQLPRETINKNMINIILAYENSASSLGRIDASEVSDQLEDSFEDRSSSSSESSDADSVQSVIIRQRVDQRGRVSASDISRVEKKLFRCDKDSETDARTDSVVTEQRVLYSEYL